jgi:hypothetical protein
MPLSPSDPYYVAEITPASIAAMEHPLCSAYGVGLDAFGAKGNTVHTSGYHRSRQWILNSPDSDYGSSDYSVRDSRDKTGDQRWVSAFDFTPGSWGTADNRNKMVAITKRVRAAARARDPRLADLREFAGTEDGRNVVTFYCADGSAKSPFDSSHLDHCHGSFWRSRANNDHSGIVAVMLGVPTGALMALSDQQQQDLWEWLALLVDPGTPPAGRPGDRFHFPPTLMQIKTKVDQLAATVGAGGLTDEQVAAQADRIAAALAAHPAVPLGDADKPAIVSAVKQALREGVAGA